MSWAAQVIVIDAFSSDRTAQIARELGAEVHVREWAGYAAQKNFGLDLADQPWIFSLDADEVVTAALGNEISATVQKPQFDAYRLFRPTFYRGSALRHYGRAPIEPGHVRLFRRGMARFNQRLVNEAIEFRGAIGTLQEPLFHYSYPTRGSYREKIHRYAVLEALERQANGRPKGGRWVRGIGKVGWMLIWRRGILDGPAAWTWIMGQGYQEWLATGQAARATRDVAASHKKADAV